MVQTKEVIGMLQVNKIRLVTSFAVHCLKDMPTTLPPGLVLGAICKRESPEDAAIIHPKHKQNGILRLKDLPVGSIIGTSSLRREALLRSQYPTLQVKSVRGNIHTRLSKLDDNDEYDAIVIAACGFRRGGLGDRIDELLPPDVFGYGVGQASIGIECRSDDQATLDMVSKLEDERSAQVCKAERSLLYHVEGGCQIAMGVHTVLNDENDTLTLIATILSRDGAQQVKGMCVLTERKRKTASTHPFIDTMATHAPRRTIYVSSRKSQLAMVQTNEVIHMLQEDTIGDQVLDRHLSELGTSTASGLFTKSLEEALIAGTASFAVHSLKDMPTTLPNGLVLGAICKRESPEDAAIIHPKHKQNGIKCLKDLPAGSIIGTSSLRREALLRSQYPTFEIKTIRGNIQTRLAKLDEHGEYDAIIVAACGFRRGGLGDRIDELLPVETFGYGVGQGSIGIECRGDDQATLEMLSQIQNERSTQLCKAERSLLYHLEGGCQIAMGVHSTLDDDDVLTLRATVLSRDGKHRVKDTISGPRFEAEALGKALASRFLANEHACVLLGKVGEKRALTYGDMEAPGDAVAKAAASLTQPGKSDAGASTPFGWYSALGVCAAGLCVLWLSAGRKPKFN
uniref:hydroxymethylbilane synthase n=1 Tax=Globisporangium ultimum (strain ATCC 200006 / CBS 805.95 / DAOM BR144) TaxID=431595 RepID=K3W5I8_GLOUD